MQSGFAVLRLPFAVSRLASPYVSDFIADLFAEAFAKADSQLPFHQLPHYTSFNEG
jgi:hypothetical protein